MWLIFPMFFVIHGSEAPLKLVSPAPELSIDEVIEKWKTASKEAGTRKGSFRIFEYDQTFMEETRGVGKFTLNSQNDWDLETQPDPDVEEGAKHDFFGKTYTLRRSRFEQLTFVNGEITCRNDNGVLRTSIEKLKRDSWITRKFATDDRLLPHYLLMFPHLHEASLKSIDIEFGNKMEEGIHLIFKPTTLSQDVILGQKIEVILDRQEFNVKAAKFHDVGGNQQTVFLLHYQ